MGTFADLRFSLFRAIQLFEDRWADDLDPRAPKSMDEFKEREVADRLHGEMCRMIDGKFFDDCEPLDSNLHNKPISKPPSAEHSTEPSSPAESEDIDEHQTIELGSPDTGRDGSEVDISTTYMGSSFGRGSPQPMPKRQLISNRHHGHVDETDAKQRPSDRFFTKRGASDSETKSSPSDSTASELDSGSTKQILKNPVIRMVDIDDDEDDDEDEDEDDDDDDDDEDDDADDADDDDDDHDEQRRETSKSAKSGVAGKMVKGSHKVKPTRGILKHDLKRGNSDNSLDDNKHNSKQKPHREKSKSAARRIVDKVVSFVKPKGSRGSSGRHRAKERENDANDDEDDDEEEDDDDDDDQDDEETDTQPRDGRKGHHHSGGKGSPANRSPRRSYRSRESRSNGHQSLI